MYFPNLIVFITRYVLTMLQLQTRYLYIEIEELTVTVIAVLERMFKFF